MRIGARRCLNLDNLEIFSAPLLLLIHFLCPAHHSPGTPPQLVAVPTHFYKVILAERGKKTVAAAFVMPNARIAAEHPLAAFSVPLSSLEEVAGVQFFPQAFAEEAKRTALDGAALRWQAQGRAELARGRIGPPGTPPALLPAPDSAPGKRVAGDAVIAALHDAAIAHLCDHVACKLPAEEFWKSGAGAKRQLQRSKSANF